MIISAEPYGSMRFSYKECMPDESLWATILPNLKSLLIFTKLSIGARKYRDALTLEEDIAQWMMWIRPYLQCFGKHIPDTLSAIVDDEGMSATREFVEHYLPGCQLTFRSGRSRLEAKAAFLWVGVLRVRVLGSRSNGMASTTAGQVCGMCNYRATDYKPIPVIARIIYQDGRNFN